MTTETTTPVDRFVKKACPICGKMVSSHGMPWSNHAKKHAREQAESQTAQSTQPTESAKEPMTETPEVQKPKEIKLSKAVPKLVDPDEQRLMERALAVQEEMAQTPEAFVAEDTTDAYAKLVEVYAPEARDQFDKGGKLLKHAPLHAFFGHPERMEIDVNNGYKPVVNERGYFVKGPGGEPLYTIDRKISDARALRTQMESRRRLSKAQEVISGQSSKGAPMSVKEGDDKFVRYSGAELTRKPSEIGE
jgi:hypothetical protein